MRELDGRITVWPLARELVPVKPTAAGVGPAVALVRASRQGWAESDLPSLRGERPLRFDPGVDARAPVVAAATRSRSATGASPEARLVVWGSERGVLGRRLNRADQRDFNRELFLGSLAWLLDDNRLVALSAKRPEQVRPVLDERQIRLLYLCCAVALPLCPLTVALWLLWRRRR